MTESVRVEEVGTFMFSKNEIDELLQCFLAESVEHLEGIEPLILQLETASPSVSNLPIMFSEPLIL